MLPWGKESVFMELFEKITGTIANQGQKAVDKAKELADIAKLKGQIVSCEEVIKENYLEIGKLVYEKREVKTEELEKQFTAISNAKAGIEDLQKKINEIKAE